MYYQEEPKKVVSRAESRKSVVYGVVFLVRTGANSVKIVNAKYPGSIVSFFNV